MLSNYARSLLSPTYPSHPASPLLPTHTPHKHTQIHLRSYVSAFLLFLFLGSCLLSAIKELALRHPVFRLSPSATGEQVPVPVQVPLGNWRHLHPLLDQAVGPSTFVAPHIEPRLGSVPLFAEGDTTDFAKEDFPELFLAPDATEEDPSMTLAEVEAWTRAYNVLPETITRETKGKGSKKKKRSGRKPGSAVRLVNQD